MAKGNTKYLQIAAYVLLAAIFVFAIGVFRNCGKLHYVEREGFSSGDTLDIALIYGPGSYYIYGDTLGGINKKIAEDFGNQTGTPIKLWPVTEPLTALENLQKGAFDILASLPLDNTIKKQFPVSESIFLDRLVLVELSDSAGGKTVNSSLDLNGKKVYVAAGSSALQRMKNLSDEIGGEVEIVEMPEMSDELLTLQVANGSIPLAVVNERVAKAIAQRYPLLKYDSSVSFTQFQVWVFNPQDTIAFKNFNIWFDSFSRTGDYLEILNTY